MILAIACKDKEKKSHPPHVRHEFAVFVKKVTSVVNQNLKTKQQSLKAFKLKFINVADFFRKNTLTIFHTQFASHGIQNHLRLVLGFESQIKESTLFF